MHKIREALRLKFDYGLSTRRIAAVRASATIGGRLSLSRCRRRLVCSSGSFNVKKPLLTLLAGVYLFMLIANNLDRNGN